MPAATSGKTTGLSKKQLPVRTYSLLGISRKLTRHADPLSFILVFYLECGAIIEGT
jgi:hypothetical protein